MLRCLSSVGLIKIYMGYLILGARTSEQSVLPFLKFCAHALKEMIKKNMSTIFMKLFASKENCQNWP